MKNKTRFVRGIIILLWFFCGSAFAAGPQDTRTLAVPAKISAAASPVKSSEGESPAKVSDTYSDLKTDVSGGLEKFQDLLKKAGSLNHSVILEDAINAREAFVKKLQRLSEITPPDAYRKTHFSFILYYKQALKGMDFVIAGIKQRDEKLEEKGWFFIALAKGDAARVTKTDQASVWQPGMNFGFNASLSTGDSLAFSLSGSFSWSVSRNIDIGPSVTTMWAGDIFSLSAQVFCRWNFINAFKERPEIVPYVGCQGGLNLCTIGGTMNPTFPVGGQAGLLWFLSRDIALNCNAMANYTFNSLRPWSFNTTVGIRLTIPSK
jgi:hypothetical protein